MRLSDLGEKEVVNLYDGGRFGLLSETELLIDEKYGKIRAMLVPDYRSKGGIFSSKNYIQIPWNSIKKIGNDIIIVETEDDSFYL